MTAKCPKCERSISDAKIADIELKGTAVIIAGLVITCPHCDIVLGIQVDPVQLKKDTVAEVTKAIGRK